jgi:hypothetical protein
MRRRTICGHDTSEQGLVQAAYPDPSCSGPAWEIGTKRHFWQNSI